MRLYVPPTEQTAKEAQQEILLNAIDQLQEAQRQRPLTPTQSAALEFLERLVYRSIHHNGAVINQETIQRAVNVAHRAVEVKLCVH